MTPTKDREFNHQIAVPFEHMGGSRLGEIADFHAWIKAPIQSQSLFKKDRWYKVYCFAEPHDAASFQVLFGGELISTDYLQHGRKHQVAERSADVAT